MLKGLVLRAMGKVALAAQAIGFNKNATFIVGGYRYRKDEFMGYSDEKIADILEMAGANPEQIAAIFRVLVKMGRGK
jgi:hypothetical protein